MATRTAASAQGLSFSPLAASPRFSPPARSTAAGLRLASARTGDHPAIHRMLMSVFHGPSLAEYQAQLDEPGYQPADRLLIKHGDDVAAHLRLAPQVIQLDSTALPAARFMDLATAPEYRSRGLATALLTAGQRAAAERGALIGLTRTRAPALFARLGWAVCGRHFYSTAASRAVLAELGALASGLIDNTTGAALRMLRPQPEQVVVRPMRRNELPAVMRIYEQNLAGRCGWPIRSEPYWEWLLARAAFDNVYVAALTPEPSDSAGLLASIAGYAFVRQGRIVELITLPGRDDVARHLLVRVCADASEQGDWSIRCDVPPGDVLHDMLHRAGGALLSSRQQGGELFMARLFDPLAVLRRLIDLFAARGISAGLARPIELGIDLRSGIAGGVEERYRLHLGRRSTSVTTGGPVPHRVVLRCVDLAPLVLGDVGAQDMAVTGRIRFSSHKARRLAAALFPNGRWWRPPLDDLLA